MKKLVRFVSSHKLLILICIALGLIPFFWFKLGQIDIGGDSTRLYFYQPLSYLNNLTLNPFLPDSIGIRGGQTYSLPFVCLLLLFQYLFKSPWLVNIIFDDIILVGGFLSIYAIVSELIRGLYDLEKVQKKINIEISAMLAGLFYLLIPLSSNSRWDLALVNVSDRFAYPFMFLLLLKFINTSKTFYLLFAILTSVLFAQNFAWVSFPNMFAFFFLGSIFLAIYAKYIKKTGYK